MASLQSAGGTGERERTVSFYEIIWSRNSSADERFEHADWQQILRMIEDAPLEKRVYRSPTKVIVGEVIRSEARAHLKLMLVRDIAAWLEIYDERQASIEPLELGGREVLEASIVTFLDYGNVVGLIRGSAVAPGPSHLSDWLNGLGIISEMFIDVRAMMAHSAMKQLKRVREVSQVSVQVHTNKADVLDEGGLRLGAILRGVKQEYGPMTVELVLKPGRSRDAEEGRQAVYEESVRIADVSNRSSAIEKASAKLMHFDAEGRSHSEDVDFAKQRVTAKKNVLVSDEDGNPIRDASAVRAILEAARESEDELRQIVEAGNDARE